ncbi:hypothetical protein IV38_GL000934 [Lactobacillus selangorensis]|uniref:PTS EIIB type-3 domain-containing protein n=2 Tax=Lactobacillus selangorensis TaxID=81857 RepID=A0A0R2FU43_9LACO|nr:hypothetical protein IV38_GL000934 [Lactobacillus selangorensis]KRN32860.1 hypothetical protein IV40_GL000919 [Lactobacillus selangorensis]
MQKAAAARHLDATVFARGFGAIPQAYRKSHPDVILLGPQVRYVLRSVQKEVPVPVAVINMTDYGMMDGEKVLTQALDLLSQK